VLTVPRHPAAGRAEPRVLPPRRERCPALRSRTSATA
jgi:hypothetical protein